MIRQMRLWTPMQYRTRMLKIWGFHSYLLILCWPQNIISIAYRGNPENYVFSSLMSVDSCEPMLISRKLASRWLNYMDNPLVWPVLQFAFSIYIHTSTNVLLNQSSKSYICNSLIRIGKTVITCLFRTLGCARRTGAMRIIRGMSTQRAMSTTTTRATRIGSPPIVYKKLKAKTMKSHSSGIGFWRIFKEVITVLSQ